MIHHIGNSAERERGKTSARGIFRTFYRKEEERRRIAKRDPFLNEGKREPRSMRTRSSCEMEGLTSEFESPMKTRFAFE